MNTYQCWHPKNESCVMIKADTQYDAQCKAGEHWKIKKNKQYQIAIMLVEKNGVEVIHSTSEV